jgi:ABC-type phosphate/phosphonate transport system substrate-binding protein
MPPWVISRRVPAKLRHDIRDLLLTMHAEPFGRPILDRARLDRFVAADDRDYDPIRAMAANAARVSLVERGPDSLSSLLLRRR